MGGREQAQLEKTHGQPTPERLGKEASIVMNISITITISQRSSIFSVLSDELHREIGDPYVAKKNAASAHVSPKRGMVAESSPTTKPAIGCFFS